MEQIEQFFGERLQQIRRMTEQARIDSPLYRSFAEELQLASPLYAGDYQKRLIMAYENQAVDLPTQVILYTQRLLAIGEKPIEIVDFGSGGARTTTSIACQIAESISSGLVRITATNLSSIPTLEQLPQVRNLLHAKHYQQLERVLKEGLVNFVMADITELYQMMGEQTIHLLFNIDTLVTTFEINDLVLQATAQMLHPKLGSVVFGFPNWRGKIDTRAQLLKKGLDLLEARGFRNRGRPVNPLIRSMAVYQASEAPEFHLTKG